MMFTNVYAYLEETTSLRAEYANILTKLSALAEYRADVAAERESSISASPTFLGTEAKKGFDAERDIIKKKLDALKIYRSAVPHMSKEDMIVSKIYGCKSSTDVFI